MKNENGKKINKKDEQIKKKIDMILKISRHICKHVM